MGSIDKMIQWFRDREGKVTYSMTNRLGPNSYDCSSAVYYALIAGGFIPSGSMGWTGSLHDTTLPPITTKISRGECRKGDIFVSKYWATDGHTGVFLDNGTIIHCSYGRNGIYATPASGGYMGPEPTEYYRLKNVSDIEIFAALDNVNLNSSSYKIVGWMTSTKDIRQTTPFLFFMDATTNTEIARQKMTRITRNDVAKIHNTVNGAAVGWVAEGYTSEKLLGKKYKIMVRYASDSGGNAGVIEKTFGNLITAPSKVNEGSIDVFKAVGNKQNIVGWHGSWNMSKAKYGFVILLENGKEIKRGKVESIIKRKDVEALLGTEIYGSINSGFSVNIDVTGLRGKTVTLLHRYTNNPDGNAPISDYYFTKKYTL